MAEFIRTEGVPVYVQIRESLRAEITGGLLKRGEQLPSENELASKYNVSRMTIRESIEDLVDEGLLYRRHGVGTFVAYPHLQRDHTRLTSFFDKAENEGIRVQVTLLNLRTSLGDSKGGSSIGHFHGKPNNPREDVALCGGYTDNRA